jgi:inner membrane protein
MCRHLSYTGCRKFVSGSCFMPSSFSHAVAAIALGKACTSHPMPARFWILSAACAIAPDFDVMCTRLGIAYTDMFGHRGITHSLLFAMILSALITLLAFRKPLAGISRGALFLFFFAATASHGILDAMVEGTLGVAFFAPFSAERHFLFWRPIVSSPVGWSFFSAAGVGVLMNEFVWLWVPSIAIIFGQWLRKRLKGENPEQEQTA